MFFACSGAVLGYGFFLYSSVSHGIGVPLFLDDLCTPLACFSHVLAQPWNMAMLVILGIWCASLVSFLYILAIGVPLFHGEL